MRRSRLLLLEAAKTSKDLPDGVLVRVRKSYQWLKIDFVDATTKRQSMEPYGSISIGPPEGSEHCSGGWTVGYVMADKRWGPLLYHVNRGSPGL